MVRIKPFRGIRPPAEHAAEVASRPYDVLNSAEAQQEATEKSLLHIIKPEIDFSPIADEHSDEVYARAVENFRAWREKDGSCRTIRKNIMFMPRRWTAGRSTDWWRPVISTIICRVKSKSTN